MHWRSFFLDMRRSGVLAVVVALPLMGSGDWLREDEFECESAVAHLQECCPEDLELDGEACVYASGCDSETLPILSVSDARCLEVLSCSEIEENDLCETVAELTNPTYDDGEPTYAPSSVCPGSR
jgi:hypothetical protein